METKSLIFGCRSVIHTSALRWPGPIQWPAILTDSSTGDFVFVWVKVLFPNWQSGQLIGSPYFLCHFCVLSVFCGTCLLRVCKLFMFVFPFFLTSSFIISVSIGVSSPCLFWATLFSARVTVTLKTLKFFLYCILWVGGWPEPPVRMAGPTVFFPGHYGVIHLKLRV